jgi:hypothetical protein
MRQLLPIIAGTTGDTRARALAKLQTEAERVSKALRAASVDYVNGPALKAAIIKGQREVLKAGGSTVKFGGVNVPLLARLTRETSRDLYAASLSPPSYLRKSITQGQAIGLRFGQPVKMDLSLTQALARGVLERATPRGLKQAVLNELGLSKGDRVLLLNGRTYDAGWYAETVARTRTAEANSDAKAEEMQTRGYKFIQTTAHAGVDPKDICYFLQGKVWALQENNLGIPLLPEEYGLPPWHPNCVHTFSPWIPEFRTNAQINKAVSSHADDSENIEKWRGPNGSARTYQLAKTK